MKRSGLGLLATGLVLASGCVSQKAFDDVKAHEAELAWRCDVAEKSVLKLESDKKLAQREADVSREDARCAREKLALANDALRDAKKEVDEELKARLAELQSKAPTKQELSPWGGVVLESGILFAPGRHELTKSGETALGPLVESLVGPQYDGFQVELSGHTDADPLKATAKVYVDNHDLAAKRANAVRRFLITRGVPTSRIYLSAWGETRPLAPETSGEGKASNRRVEIRLHHVNASTELAGSARRGTEAEPQPASTPRIDAPATDRSTPSDDVSADGH